MIKLLKQWWKEFNCIHCWCELYKVDGLRKVYCNRCWKEIKLPKRG